MVVRHIARVASNHCPILVNLQKNKFKTTKVTRFEDSWASYYASYAIVEKVCSRKVVGCFSEMLNIKSRRTLRALFFWSKAKIEDLNSLKEILKLEILDLKLEEVSSSMLSVEKLFILRSKVKELNCTLARLNTWWRKHSKINWLSEGDYN